MKEILQQQEKVLREIAKEVPLEEIGTKKIQGILKEMSEALKSQNDGVAIAAPQIGYSLRIFVVSGKIFLENFGEETDPENKKVAPKKKIKIKDMIFINPKISKVSKNKEWMPEGCLSVRWLYGKTHRSKKVTVTAYDETGRRFTRGASGLLAQIFQHETDHLNGILFIDTAQDIREELPKQNE